MLNRSCIVLQDMLGIVMKNKNTFTLRLPDTQLKTLKETAKRERRTVSAVIRNLINDFQKKIDAKKT